MKDACGEGAGAEATGVRRRQQSPPHPGPYFLSSPPHGADPQGLLSLRVLPMATHARSEWLADAAVGHRASGRHGLVLRRGGAGRGEPQNGGERLRH